MNWIREELNLGHKWILLSGKNGTRNMDNFADIFTSKDGSLIPNKHRAFLMDTQVKYTIVSIIFIFIV